MGVKEDILKIFQKLVFKYTSNESSSITYETANMLMGAIIYCIREYYTDDDKELYEDNFLRQGQDDAGLGNMIINDKTNVEQAYLEGYEKVIKKVYRTKQIYDEIIDDFEDYGCLHYRDTILKGMPEFFLRYDPKFCPQDHLLTLDYPVMHLPEELTGIDRIYVYLLNIKKEKKYLDRFPVIKVIEILEKESPENEELYLGNICELVLKNADFA